MSQPVNFRSIPLHCHHFPLFLSPYLILTQRRREQNRTSQQKFREKSRKDYEAVVQALEAEKEMSARLRDEVTALHTTIECLAKGNQNCLETISKLVMAGYVGKDASEGMGDLERLWGGELPRLDGDGLEGL